jgi:hypothetical protein
MFRTFKCSSSGRFVHAVVWYFFHIEIVIIEQNITTNQNQFILLLMFYELNILYLDNSYSLLLQFQHERNTIKLDVQVFLRMKNWMFETCQKH